MSNIVVKIYLFAVISVNADSIKKISIHLFQNNDPTEWQRHIAGLSVFDLVRLSSIISIVTK